MKTEKNILVAFVLNLVFAIFEFFGGVYTGSVAILSDALHDIGDAASIGVSYFLEKKSKSKPDDTYTYGYGRFSVVGSVVTTCFLLVGSFVVIYNAVMRILQPAPINYNGMILFAIIGVCVNLVAAFVTREGDSLNQKAVNLHMLEDGLGWVAVLIGAVVMRFTDISVLDPVMSIGIALFIGLNAVGNLKSALYLFLERTPANINVKAVVDKIVSLETVEDVHHVHIWSMDGQYHYATMHVVTDADPSQVKKDIRELLEEFGIVHVTLELEGVQEHCGETSCCIQYNHESGHCHHHHHHHHTKRGKETTI